MDVLFRPSSVVWAFARLWQQIPDLPWIKSLVVYHFGPSALMEAPHLRQVSSHTTAVGQYALAVTSNAAGKLHVKSYQAFVRQQRSTCHRVTIDA